MRVIAISLLSKLSSFYQNGEISADEKNKLGNIISESVKKNDKQFFINEIIRFKRISFQNDVCEELLGLI